MNPGCYVRPITYAAPPNQIQALIQLSRECEQSIQYDCLDAPLRNRGIDYGFWLDREGSAQVYWDGANGGNHVCGCHFSEEGCLEEDTMNTTCTELNN